MEVKTTVPVKLQRRLIRLISARNDMRCADDAFQRYMATDERDELGKHHLFLAMVMAYGRPFTENHGLGALTCEYSLFPDFPDPEMNVRHKRMMDLRNKFMGHSSIEGTKVWLLAPGSASPATGELAVGYGYALAKLDFLDPRFAVWLHQVVVALDPRLLDSVRLAAQEIGSKHLNPGERCLLDTGTKPFGWTQ
jgi:hypothetical protein